MARKIREELIDDIDGSEAVHTEQVTIAGVTYELDLSERNYSELYKALAPFMTHGRKVKRTVVSARPNRQAAADAVRNSAVREWARAHGMSCPDKGRIPRLVLEAYAKRTEQHPAAQSEPEPVAEAEPESHEPVSNKEVLAWARANLDGSFSNGYVSTATAAKYRDAHPGVVLARDARPLQVTG